jgi:hypothetical protein
VKTKLAVHLDPTPLCRIAPGRYRASSGDAQPSLRVHGGRGSAAVWFSGSVELYAAVGLGDVDVEGRLATVCVGEALADGLPVSLLAWLSGASTLMQPAARTATARARSLMAAMGLLGPWRSVI